MSKITTSTARQLLAVSIPSLFVIASLIIGKLNRFGIAFIPWIIICAALLIISAASLRRCGRIRPRLSPIIPVMIIFSVIVLIYCGNTPQYDETLYFYKALISADEFNFSLNSILSLAWHKHPMLPYAMFITAGQVVFGGYTTVVIQNLIISLLTIFSVYKLIIHYTSDDRKGRLFSAIGAAAFAFSPFFITHCLCLNSDFPILAFAPIFVYALIYNKKVIASVAAFFLLFSKLPGTATGIIIICSMIVIEIVQKKEGIAKALKNRISLLIPLAITIIYLIFFLEIWADSFLSSGSGVPNCFAFNFRYIMVKLAQIFILQYNWILTAIILIGGAHLLISKRVSPSQILRSSPATLAIIISSLAYLFYCLAYVTNAHVRYHKLTTMYLTVLAIVILYRCINIYIIRYMISSIASLLILSSFFANSDPVSNALFASYDFSGNRIIYTHAFAWETYAPDITDSVAYNAKFTQLNKLYGKILKEMKITTDDNIIHLNFCQWTIDLAGSWKLGALSYDNETHERSVVLYSEDGYDMPTCYYAVERHIKDYYGQFKDHYYIDEFNANPDLLPDEAIIILFPWQSEGIELFGIYNIVEETTISHGGFEAICYRVSK